MFKFDMHVHTVQTSNCGCVKGSEIVYRYKEAGYHGIVITDHYYQNFFDCLEGRSWEQKVDRYLEGYMDALGVAQNIGFSVLLGIEMRFNDSPNDYLIYGIDECFLKQNPRLYNMDLEKFREFTYDKGILIYQAHPFRLGLSRSNPVFLDGVEVYNGNPRHESRNSLAYEFARENNLRMISGSDFHQDEDLAKGGVVISINVHSAKDLVALLQTDHGICNLIGEFFVG